MDMYQATAAADWVDQKRETELHLISIGRAEHRSLELAEQDLSSLDKTASSLPFAVVVALLTAFLLLASVSV